MDSEDGHECGPIDGCLSSGKVCDELNATRIHWVHVQSDAEI